MRPIKQHVIHCSDSGFGNVAIIREWHLQRNFNDIGYHFVIRADGQIEVGRPLEIKGAHCKECNATSIGTCLIGKDGRFSQDQYDSLMKLHDTLEQLFPSIEAYPHNHFNPQKTCPEFNIYKFLPKPEDIK